MQTKFNWDLILNKLENDEKSNEFLIEVENLTIPHIHDSLIDSLYNQIRIQTKYLSDEEAAVLSIYRFLQIMIIIDVQECTKDISLSNLQRNLLKDKLEKETEIKDDPNYSTLEKDILIENLEKKYKEDLIFLKSNYKKNLEEWAVGNLPKIQYFAKIRNTIREWFKRNSNQRLADDQDHSSSPHTSLF